MMWNSLCGVFSLLKNEWVASLVDSSDADVTSGLWMTTKGWYNRMCSDESWGWVVGNQAKGVSCECFLFFHWRSNGQRQQLLTWWRSEVNSLCQKIAEKKGKKCPLLWPCRCKRGDKKVVRTLFLAVNA